MKKLLAALFSVILFFSFVQYANAQSVSPTVSASQPQQTAPAQQDNKTVYPLQTESNVPQNFHTYSQNVFIEILTSISCILTGYDPLNPTGKCLGINPTSHKIGYMEAGQGGAIGIVGNMIGMTFNIPVSSGTYIKDIAANFGISKTGYAALPAEEGGASDANFSAGYGYAGLKPVLSVWKIFRNLIYLMLVLIFIIIGVGIMLRVNVDARSVMTIQNQLPKIIIGIILITLSYAIAGFIVDMMYVVMYLIFYLFTQQSLSYDVSGLNPTNLQGATPLNAIGGMGGASSIAFGAAKPFGGILASLFDNTFGHVIATIIGTMIGGGAGSLFGPIGAVVGGAIGLAVGVFAGSKLLGLIGGLLAYIIITIAVLWAMFRLWFLLLRSYVFFLIDVILAPFWIGLGLLPKGASAGFGSWMRDIIANLAVFPATLFILLLGKTITIQFSASAGAHSFVPPLVGNPGDPDSFGPIIGLGIILLLPSVVTMVRETLKAPGFKYTQQIAQSLGQGQKVGGMLFGKTKDALWHTNPKDGSPERLKKWYLDRFRNASNGKAMQAVTSPIATVGSKIPILGNRVKKRRTNNAAEAALSRSAENELSIRHGSEHMQHRAGRRNAQTGLWEGTIGGERAVDNGDGTVTIYPKVGGEKKKSADGVHWDRREEGEALPHAAGPVNPETTPPQDTAGPDAPATGAGRPVEGGGEPTPSEAEGFNETELQQFRSLLREEIEKPENAGASPERLAELRRDVASRIVTRRAEGGPIAEAPSAPPPEEST